MAWSVLFLKNSFSSTLPWASDAKGFFYGEILQISDGVGQIGGIVWPLFFALLIVWVLIYLSVWKGVKSVGKVVMITMPLPIILLIILFIRGITLPGALEGIGYYLRPDFSAMWNAEIWLAAASQIFFTLSIGLGIMIAYSSYNKKDSIIVGNTWTTALTNSGISLFAGFVVFSVLGYMSTATGVGIADVAASGPGFAFVVFPQALSLMPMAWLFAAIFFLTLLSLGIDSAFSLVEAVNTAVKDRFPRISVAKIAAGVCAVSFAFGVLYITNAGLYFLDIVDHFVMNFGLVIAGLIEAIAVGWVFGAKRMREYINSVSNMKLGAWWDVLIKWVIPVILIVLLVVQFITEITTPYEGYPQWAINVGWGAVVVPLIVAAWLAFKKE